MVDVISATEVGILADVDYGEGWIVFRWPDDLNGHDLLQIDLDGHCTKRMPIRSGEGPPDFVDLRRDAIRFRFDPVLAKKLELAEEIEIRFTISDADFDELRKVVNYFNGDDDCEPCNRG